MPVLESGRVQDMVLSHGVPRLVRAPAGVAPAAGLRGPFLSLAWLCVRVWGGAVSGRGEIALVGSIFLRTPSPRGLLGPISPYLANLAYGALIALMGSIF